MTTDDHESAETPAERVAALDPEQRAEVLTRLVASILANKDTRGVPDILHDSCLLAQFEVYDADHAWHLLEDRARDGDR